MFSSIPRTKAQKMLMHGTIQYYLHAKHSPVAGIVFEAVTASVKGDQVQRAYLIGYIDATLEAVARQAPKAEAHVMATVLLAAKALLDPDVVVAESGVGIALLNMEHLADGGFVLE